MEQRKAEVARKSATSAGAKEEQGKVFRLELLLRSDLEPMATAAGQRKAEVACKSVTSAGAKEEQGKVFCLALLLRSDLEPMATAAGQRKAEVDRIRKKG